jgi:hypothetical protein
VHRHLDEIQFVNLGQGVAVLVNTLRNSMQIQIIDVELKTFFGHSSGWEQEMITQHLHSLNNENPTGRHSRTFFLDQPKSARLYRKVNPDREIWLLGGVA